MSTSLFDTLCSWSFTRDRMLRECPRRFHFHYIAARGGHRPGGPPGSRDAWLAKAFTTVPIEVGSLVHKAISNIWWHRVGGQEADIGAETESAQLAFIESLMASGKTTPENGTKHFIADIFGPPPEFADMEAATHSIGQMMSAFSEFPFVKALLANPSPIKIRYLDCDRPEISTCLGFPAWLKTDLVVHQASGWDIVEWKTGRPSPAHATQAEVYDIYLRKAELLPDSTPTHVHIVYLKTGHIDTRQFTAAERALALRRLEESYERIAALFADRTAASLSPDRFPPQPGRHCFGCNFQGLCTQSATRASAPVPATPVLIEDDF